MGQEGLQKMPQKPQKKRFKMQNTLRFELLLGPTRLNRTNQTNRSKNWSRRPPKNGTTIKRTKNGATSTNRYLENRSTKTSKKAPKITIGFSARSLTC